MERGSLFIFAKRSAHALPGHYHAELHKVEAPPQRTDYCLDEDPVPYPAVGGAWADTLPLLLIELGESE